MLRPSAASTPHDLPPLPSSLADIAKLGGAHDEVLLDVAYQESSSWKATYKHGKSRKLFATIGGAELAVWSVRVGDRSQRPSSAYLDLVRMTWELMRYE